MRAWLALVLAAGCGGTTNNNTYIVGPGDLAITLPDGEAGPCTPGMKDCVSDSLARVCPADGTGWLAQPCGATATCMNGDCVQNVVSGFVCIPGTTACLDASNGLKCRSDGQGYTMINCPANTACVGAAKCVGSCTVGATTCVGTAGYNTCTDGFTTMPAMCNAGTFCVTDATGNGACKSGDCSPDPGGCNTVCGDKNNPSADQTKSISTCVSTPTGFHWLVSPCASGSCNPSGGFCGGGGKQASCTTMPCTPGQMRCSSSGDGIDTCDPTGNWPAVPAPCNNDPTNGQLICFTVGGKPVCGDPVCFGHAGSCDANANFIACMNGRLAAAGAPCTMGACVSSGAPVGGILPGSCVAQCVAGEQRCVATGATSYQQCSANGLWGAPIDCPSASVSTEHCFGYTDDGGHRATVCGVCQPGRHRCVYTDGGMVTLGIETCDPTGQWGALSACTVGVCTPSAGGGGDAECVAQCVPGATVCLGPPKAGVGAVAGTTASGTCNADGTLPPAPDCVANPSATGCCAGTSTCRRTSTGTAVACVDCVGSSVAGGNEVGVPDTRCSGNSDMGTAAVQTCGGNNAWPSASNPCPSGTSCVSGSSQVCGTCYGLPNCTSSALSANFGGATCATIGQSAIACGGFTDCCQFYCTTGTTPGSLSFCR